MSRHSKTYGKRGSSVPVASINFDKLIADNGKRPTASKSAGVIGKWGTTSFTSLRSSQVNGEKAVKRGMSPVKCGQNDFSSNSFPLLQPRSSDPFGFELSCDNAANPPSVTAPATQAKPRKFFKSRASEETITKTEITHQPLPPVPFVDHTMFVEPLLPLSTYSPPSLLTSQNSRRARGRPRGSRNLGPNKSASPSSSSPAKATGAAGPTRGAGKGRRRSRSSRLVRGQTGGSGRGKRKRHQWEESEDEEDHVSSEEEEEEEMLEHPQLKMEQVHDHSQLEQVKVRVEETMEMDGEDEDGVLSPEDAVWPLDEAVSNNGWQDSGAVAEDAEEKRPIKLRIIRRNDTDAFVSKVDDPTLIGDYSGAVKKVEDYVPVAVPVVAPVVAPATVVAAPSAEALPMATEAMLERASPVMKLEHAYPAAVIDYNAGDALHGRLVFQEEHEMKEEAPSLEPSCRSLVSPMEEVVITVPASSIIQHQQKKSCIFKSRSGQSAASGANLGSALTTGAKNVRGDALLPLVKGKKGLALYRHKWHEDDAAMAGAGGGAGAGAGGAAVVAGSVAAAEANADGNGQSFDWNDLGDEPAQPSGKSARVASKPAYQGDPLDEDVGGGSIRCPKRAKDYYTVVRNVKKAHQIQESGEFQEFNDDVDYILDALQAQNPTATRCLSAMSLASKCMEPAFRMHLRAHSTVAKFFQALKDAPSKASVALCTSCIMFVLTQDRLNMDLDRDSLELMLNLLETDAVQMDAGEGKELEKNRLKVREICEEMVRKGHAPHLQLDSITSAQLAMETLLSLTSKKAGEWFKEELRVLGGLDHIIQTVTLCTDLLTSEGQQQQQRGLDSAWSWDKLRLDALKKVDRCLRVLENVTFQNEENQNYLLEYSCGRLVDATLRLLRLLAREVTLYSHMVAKDSLGHILSEALSNLMKVIMNLTHDNNDESVGSRVYGDRPLTWQMAFVCMLQTPQSLPEEKRFDVTTLALGILINLVERRAANRDHLLAAPVPTNNDDIFDDSKATAIGALIDLFNSKEESARLEEARTDEILDGKAPSAQTEGSCTQAPVTASSDSHGAVAAKEDAMEETVKKLLHKAGRHMEDSMVAAYVGLLIGYVVMYNKAYERQVKQLLPNNKFTLMVSVLKKFYEFLKLTANAVTSSRGLKNTELVIKFMESSDSGSTSSGASTAYRYKSDD